MSSIIVERAAVSNADLAYLRDPSQQAVAACNHLRRLQQPNHLQQPHHRRYDYMPLVHHICHRCQLGLHPWHQDEHEVQRWCTDLAAVHECWRLCCCSTAAHLGTHRHTLQATGLQSGADCSLQSAEECVS